MEQSVSQFQAGQPYFFVVFDDEDLRIPIISTLLFSSAATNSEGKAGFLFKEVRGFESEGEEVFFEEADAREDVLDGRKLLRRLQASFDGTLATSRHPDC
jgi:hypothetical protein